jgi:hypothetical protein
MLVMDANAIMQILSCYELHDNTTCLGILGSQRTIHCSIYITHKLVRHNQQLLVENKYFCLITVLVFLFLLFCRISPFNLKFDSFSIFIKNFV